MLAAFTITFREALEAALIVGIMLGLLGKMEKKELSRGVWYGTIAGIAGSLILAVVMSVALGGFEGKVEEIFEGILMILAAAVLTYMIFWMQFNRAAFEGKIEKAAVRNSIWSLAILAFIAVVREGVETVLFFSAIAKNSDPVSAGTGGAIGVFVALGIVFAIYRSTQKVSLKPLFFWSGLVLFVIAAGLFAHGIHELQEAGILPTFVEHLYDINGLLNEKGFIGGIVKALFGYNGNPSLLEFIGYWAFVFGVGSSVLRRSKKLGLAH